MMSDADAVAALEAGVTADEAAETAGEQAVETPASTDSPAGEQTTQVQPETPVAPEAEDTFDGGKFNPDELAPELQAGWKELQAAFTQKTQQIAEQRKQFEQLGDPNEVMQAVELVNRINDPSNWAQLAQELHVAMEQAGIASPLGETDTPSPEQPNEQLPELDGLDDPELAPIAQHIKRLEDRLAQFEGGYNAEKQAAEAERQHMAFLGELQRSENAIRAARPDYNDEDVDMVYETSSFYGGDLGQAHTRLESYVENRIERYLAQKAAASEERSVQSGPKSAGTSSHQENVPETLQDAEAEALEFLQARMAQLGE